MPGYKKLDLNGDWLLENSQGLSVRGQIPGSVYSFLLAAGKMEDPYYRDNELDALELMHDNYTFTRRFTADDSFRAMRHQVLRLEGVDTLSEIFLNRTKLGDTDNMHIAWEYDVKSLLQEGENVLEVRTLSPTRYIAGMDAEHHLGGSDEAMRGFPHLRKAHCMFGWDWGPRLPDQGIWKDVMLLGWEESRIEDIRIVQRHTLPDGSAAQGGAEHAAAAREGDLRVILTVNVVQSGLLPVSISLTSPQGIEYELKNGYSFEVPQPQLWWPNGLGGQPLYVLKVWLEDPMSKPYVIEKKIGLRAVTMRRKPDAWGETFATEVNGQTFFAMGADYIPEDNILSRLNRGRTEKLLADCREAHFNVIRVWGGGFYPHDYFYDLCDEMGFLIWQDLMFACANYRLTDRFVESIREEIKQNVRRIRHHASLALWCGNNEMEQFALERTYDGDDQTAADYLIQNEFIIPEVLKEEDPDTFYWPSSPSSGGKFVFPRDPNRGDVHYWDVWHSGVPFTAYREYYFRYLSEFGFQSFPCLETVKSFTEESDRNIFSYVMEMHQRNSGANGKIMQYLSATYLYPTNFEILIYASQLLQAEAIRYGVEHFRRNRGQDRCMGAVYWQLNDIWPVASWSSVDYYYRWKALQYYAKRFFAPVLLSCEESSEVSQGRTCISEPGPVKNSIRLNISNETWETVSDTVLWELRDPQSELLAGGEIEVQVEPFSTLWLEEMDFSAYQLRHVHVNYRLKERGSAGSVLFTAPKHYDFADPHVRLIPGNQANEVKVLADAYAKSVEIYSEDGYVRLEDNFFNMERGERTLCVLEGEPRNLKVRSVYDIR